MKKIESWDDAKDVVDDILINNSLRNSTRERKHSLISRLLDENDVDDLGHAFFLVMSGIAVVIVAIGLAIFLVLQCK